MPRRGRAYQAHRAVRCAPVRWRAISLGGLSALAVGGLVLAFAPGLSAARAPRLSAVRAPRLSRPRAGDCPAWGRPAIAADPEPHALRVFAIQFAQRPAAIVKAASYEHAIDCAMRTEVVPYLAHGRPNLVVFDRSEEHTSELQSLRHLVCR